MSVPTQGTQFYFIDPADDSVVEVKCVTTLNPGGAPADQIDVTCLADFVKKFKAGLRTPGQASATINADPQIASHIRLYELSDEDHQPVVKWAIGWSDGTAAPTVDTNGSFIFPTTRTFFSFDGYVSDFPLDFATNSVVATSLTIQRSGKGSWDKKVIV